MVRLTVSDPVYNELVGLLRRAGYAFLEDHKYGDPLELHGVELRSQRVQRQPRRQPYAPMMGDE